MIRRNRHARRHEADELNITAFMNLMVILVPFLLITAVFSRMAILELNLPAASSTDRPPDEALALEIIVRKSGIEVGDRYRGILKTLPSTAAGYDLEGLGAYLRDEVKARFPDKMDATLLLEPDIAYDTVVQVMDTVRVAKNARRAGARQSPEAEALLYAELFPEISIGDAPMGSPSGS